jgi:type II secretory pathway component PulC
MSKREKIILAIMTLVIIGGVIYYINSRREVVVQERESELKELNTFVGDTITGINKNNLTEPEIRTIASAEAEWVRDPYRAPVVKEEEKQQLLDVSFIYTGYLKAGKKKIAVINGLEYMTGEEVEPGGFVAREIYPDRVIIEVKGQKQKIVVPLIDY